MKKAEEYSADAAAAMGGDAASYTYCYDVFLSFRRIYTGYSPGEFLHRSLVDAGIRVFGDDDESRNGEEIGKEILRAIDGAKICIPIFSQYYACSPCCLRDLAAMVESKAKSGGGKTIIPIFCDVEPRDVRLETPLYRDDLMMRKLENIYGSEEVKAWEDALTEVGSLPGWETRSGR
ncbi:disease resistance protein L6-like [Syzygium oleosum]|uniref:disease resistance protein L6-like n=1 Tax=Syzygium oleosum TaxID=219896 RepID=UPI0011D1A87D|nr:disease resistance protein L6-like [Syzygium oleosum]